MANNQPPSVEGLQMFIGQTIFTAVEGARLGYITDSSTAANIACANIMNALRDFDKATATTNPPAGRRARK